MVFEVVICFGLPFVFLGLRGHLVLFLCARAYHLLCLLSDYIVQDHRFDIIEDLGCQPTVYASIPAIFILWFPQLLFSVVTMIYAGG
jgi:pheromone a factor receptor